MYARSGQLQASESCYQKVLSIEPSENHAKANLITIYKQTGDFEKAHLLISQLTEQNLQDADIRKAIGDLKITEGDHVGASHYLSS